MLFYSPSFFSLSLCLYQCLINFDGYSCIWMNENEHQRSLARTKIKKWLSIFLYNGRKINYEIYSNSRHLAFFSAVVLFVFFSNENERIKAEWKKISNYRFQFGLCKEVIKNSDLYISTLCEVDINPLCTHTQIPHLKQSCRLSLHPQLTALRKCGQMKIPNWS